jgi:tape measure domain-containing protein
MAVVSRVEIALDSTRAAANAKKFERSMDGVANATRDVNGRLRDAKGKFLGAGQEARKASGSFNSLTKSLGKVAAAYATFAAAQNIVRAGIQRIESERRIEFLAKGYGEVSKLQAAATASAGKFGISQTEANKALATSFARLRPVGVSLADIVSTYNGFNTAAKLSGATAEESSNAFTQLAQALGSGALRGDEFNSISEQVPGILTAISKETGVAQGQLRKYAAEGKITSDVVINALKRIETEGAEQLKQALGGPAQKIKDFQNASEEVAVAIAETILPDLAQAFRDLGQIILELKGPIKTVAKFAADQFSTVSQTIRMIKGATGDKAAQRASVDVSLSRGELPFVPFAKEIFGKEGLNKLRSEAAVYAKLRNQTFDEAFVDLAKDRLTAMEGDDFITGAVEKTKISGITRTDSDTDTNKEKGRVDMSAQMLKLQRERLDLLLEEDRLAIAQKDNQIELLRISEANYKPNERTFQILKANNNLGLEKKDIDADQLDRYNKIKEAIEGLGTSVAEDWIKKQDELAAKSGEKLKTMYESIGQSITTGIVDSLTAAVEGTKSLADVASQTLRQVANILLQFGVNTALGGIPGFGDFFKAKGGPVSGGSPYMVGEKGPELFVPNTSGTIVPNNKLGGGGGGSTSVVVNVDAKGSSASGDSGAGKQLGGLIGAAVQAELIKQQRPGGLLSR